MAWEVKKLGDVCEFQNGFAFKSKDFTDSGIPVIRITNIQNEEIDESSLVYVNLPELKNKLSSFEVHFNDLLIAMSGATTGKIGFHKTDRIFYLNQRVGKFVPGKNLDIKFLYYYLSTQVEENLRISAGSAQPNLSTEQINNFEIPLPSLLEQRRIVAILDKAFESITRAKENAEKNLNNANEIFESYLQSIFDNKGDGWEEKTIQEITTVVNGYAFASKDFKSTNIIKSIKITNVGVKEFIEETDNYLPEKFTETLKEYQVREGNIVIALTRTIISAGLKVAVVPKSYDGALINQRVAALVPNNKIVNRQYLYNFLITKGVEKYVLAHVNTLMQPNLSINDLKYLLVPCPSLKEQQEIVNKLDKLGNETKKLESIYEKKLSDLEELKKSILQKAFKGELTGVLV